MIVVPGSAAAPAEVEPRVETGPVTESLRWLYISPDGTRTWDLTDPASPVVKLKGATGTGRVDAEAWWEESVAADGATWQGVRLGRGQVFVPVMVRAHDTETFLAEHDAFYSTLSRKSPATLRIVRPGGQWREAQVRYSAGGDTPIDIDPAKAHLVRYGLTWSKESPFWAGEPVVTRFVHETPAAFFPGPPFALGDGYTLAAADIVNPGDEDAHAVWRVEGPFTAFTVGVGSAVVTMTLTRAAGQWVEIDMRPGRLTIVDQAGVDRWDAATVVKFSPIPPGTTRIVANVSGASTGTAVQLTFTPLYGAAW